MTIIVDKSQFRINYYNDLKYYVSTSTRWSTLSPEEQEKLISMQKRLNKDFSILSEEDQAQLSWIFIKIRIILKMARTIDFLMKRFSFANPVWRLIYKSILKIMAYL